MALLSKSKYLLGLQCPKLLWMSVNAKSEMPAISEAIQHRFDQGHLIGEMAKKLFPDGINIPQDDFMGNIRKTEKVLSLGKPLFEPGIMINGLYSRADVLRPVGSGWDIIEVKSTTSVKEQHLHDVAFQKYVYEQKGMKINKCYLMHINNKYVKHGDIDVKELFILADITDDVKQYSKGMEERVKDMKAIMALGERPDVKISKNCSSPYVCDLTDKCWSFMLKDNVFDLSRGGAKSWDLFENGIMELKDIPDDFKLTEKQEIQKKCAKTGEIYVNKEELGNFLGELKYPLHFLDFETYNTAIPIYDDTRPYQRLSFQFSLHIIEKEGDAPKHISFLAEGKNDPRLTFLVSLQNVIKNNGSILVYNAAFEKGVLAELAQMYPSYLDWVSSAQNRMIDLLVPFRNFWYYNPKQEGKASIKKVLPALTGKSYSDLNINNGEAASLAFLNITHVNASEEKIKEVRKNLEAYCGLDTEALIWVLDELKKFF